MHTGVHALLTDLAGAPTELLDSTTGTITGRNTTILFGTTRTTGTTTPHRFTGQHHDPETGLHYNRHRYYNPHTTTYTTPDPLGLSPNPDSNHAYVHNPLTWVDPLGLKACPDHPVPIGPVPEKAWTVLDCVDAKGSPLPNYKGGAPYKNHDLQLPHNDSLTYLEWDVNPQIKGVNRGTERVVTGSDGSAYWTTDHYKSSTTIRSADR